VSPVLPGGFDATDDDQDARYDTSTCLSSKNIVDAIKSWPATMLSQYDIYII